MTYEEWVEKYKPIQNHLTNFAPFDGTMFETFGEELNFVREQNSSNIWTFVDTDAGEQITNGYHIVNRIGYFITEVPFNEGPYLDIPLYDEDDESEYDDDEEEN